jgi:hypothetical protein
MSERSATASHAEKLRRAQGDAEIAQRLHAAGLDDRYEEDVADALFEDALRACRRQGHDLELGYDAVAHLETLTCTRCETTFRESV